MRLILATLLLQSSLFLLSKQCMPLNSIVLFDIINPIGAKSLSDQRKVDPGFVRDRIEAALETHE